MDRRHSEPRGGAGPAHLAALRSLDGFGLADDEVDVRGWPVVDAHGEVLGTVDELLIDPRRALVEALAVASRADDGATRLAMLPMARARIDDVRREVTTDLARGDLRPIAGRRVDAARGAR